MKFVDNYDKLRYTFGELPHLTHFVCDLNAFI